VEAAKIEVLHGHDRPQRPGAQVQGTLFVHKGQRAWRVKRFWHILNIIWHYTALPLVTAVVFGTLIYVLVLSPAS
jgi:hypothetical protein